VSSALSSLGHSSERVLVDISESLPPVQTDPDLLERVIANLVENAVTWSGPDETVRVMADELDGRVDLRILDNGPGIPDAARELVFQPFQRLGDARGQGVGLGLTVSRGLLEAMGNNLRVEDTPGGGATMIIEFKTAARPHSSSHTKESSRA
jgi:two-component system sensor histidine kinase KdpD